MMFFPKDALTYDEAMSKIGDYKKAICSSALGYVKAGQYFLEEYSGRYGKGYKLHGGKCFYGSKQNLEFHEVRYFITEPKEK